MARAIIITGGNIGDVKPRLRQAQQLINAGIGIVLRCSHVYESEAWGFAAESDFKNQAMVVDTDLSPEELLVAVQEIEERLGRDRGAEAAEKARTGEPYSSRMIDIDILFYDDRVMDTPRLKLPHPLMQERDFVLAPLVEVLCAAACLAAVSCRKPVVGCDYRLTVTWQERKSEKEPIPLTTAKVYAFFVDPDEWEVTSIENARAGIVTAVGDPSRTRSYDMAAEPSGEANNVFDLQFATTPVMLLVADTRYPMWATGNANVVAGLANMYVTIKFAPLDWKEGMSEPVVKQPWKFYGYGEVHIPIRTQLRITPAVFPVGSYTSELMTSAKCYAYYGFDKANDGRVTSWEQAASGRAERKEEKNSDEYVEFPYDVEGVWKDNRLTMLLTDSKVMLVLCDDPAQEAENKIYAYGFLDLTENPVEAEQTLSVNLNSAGDKWTSGIWTVVVERPDVSAAEAGR